MIETAFGKFPPYFGSPAPHRRNTDTRFLPFLSPLPDFVDTDTDAPERPAHLLFTLPLSLAAAIGHIMHP